MTTKISADFPYKSHFVDVGSAQMHYIDEGEGNPILFLHGVPTSSYVWRNIIPYLTNLGRCIAPDLIGFGKSAKPNIAYTIFDHIHYIEKFIEALDLTDIILIVHGWGSIIGFDYAMRHPERFKGIVFYEAYLRTIDDESALSLPYQEQMLMWQDAEHLQSLVMDGVCFIDKTLPQSLMRPLSNQELACYREPFQSTGSSRPLLQYLKELSDQQTSQINQIIAQYSQKLTLSPLPKLMLYSIPGFITTIATAVWAKENLPHLEVMEVGEELHYAQESNPALMGEAISAWLQGVEQNV